MPGLYSTDFQEIREVFACAFTDLEGNRPCKEVFVKIRSQTVFRYGDKIRKRGGV